MSPRHVVIVGAGVGGLAAAVALAANGVRVTVVERAAAPGGKLRQVGVGGTVIDAGPTVFTMRWVFEEIFADAGTVLSEHVALEPVEILARHAWGAAERLDLWADLDRTADAIAAFAGSKDALRYRDFCARCQGVYQTLEHSFIRAPRPSLAGLFRGGPGRLIELQRIAPFSTLWSILAGYFHDPRLRQLFGRYATYSGSSPFLAPATLMLIAHVERAGVWLIAGGMYQLALALAKVAESHGALFRYHAEATEIILERGHASAIRLASGEVIKAEAVVINADIAAVAASLLGPGIAGAAANVTAAMRSLSALTWALLAKTEGFPLVRHNVFFSADYAREFDDILVRARLPAAPTVYVCAQDRGGSDAPSPIGRERLFCLVNAPATGDLRDFTASETEECEKAIFHLLNRCGLRLVREPETTLRTTPSDFARLFPQTGGALYGRAVHGWTAPFARPHARTRIPGLYLAGGSVHPGPGLPMAALSGRAAAAAVLADGVSRSRSAPTATRGGTSMR